MSDSGHLVNLKASHANYKSALQFLLSFGLQETYNYQSTLNMLEVNISKKICIPILNQHPFRRDFLIPRCSGNTFSQEAPWRMGKVVKGMLLEGKGGLSIDYLFVDGGWGQTNDMKLPTT